MFSAGELRCPSDMILVPAGRGILGAPEGVGEDDEHPAVLIFLNAYCLDTYEFANQDKVRVAALMATQWTVSTVACGTGVKTEIDRGPGRDGLLDGYMGEVDYTTVCGLEAQPVTTAQLPQSPRGFDGPRQPLIADWFEAKAICEAQGKRLPTEAEWERAARGRDGTCTVGMKSCTEAKRSDAQYCEPGDCPSTTADVDAFPPTDLGFYGLAGNVWEWVSDWYQSDYYKFRGDNPQGPAENHPRRSQLKVLKGGSRGNDLASVLAANRYYEYPVFSCDRYGDFGFRCAASPKVFP